MIGRLWVAGMLCAGMAAAQSASTVAPGRRIGFEVVSIRQNVSGDRVTKIGATADGFRMVNMSLARLILTAYVPRSGSAMFWGAVGSPDWVGRDRYDVEAKMAESDQAEWQRQPAQSEMLRAALQSLLAERCKLAVHREFKDAKVYSLEIGKNGPRFGSNFKVAKVDEAASAEQASPMPGGGVVMPVDGGLRFYHAPMALLASWLTNRNMGGPEVQDRTGLTGLYDMVVEWGAPTNGVSATADANDAGPSLFSAVAALGLKLEAANGQVETLVVDHVERPSGN